MGQTQSQQNTFVLQNATPGSLQVPVVLSDKLLRKLQGEDEPPTVDHLVQDKVNHELERYQQRRFIQEQRSADQVRREAQDLIDRQPDIPKPQEDPESKKVQNQVIQCYKNNPSRVLDCWKEIQEFKNLEKRALRSFIESH
ncbi:hypothetical protein EDD86DRAFT_204028 [Gorgonomyces haynaldii]|nr:hypothetical protein EDD86DRAFT_204028 [Gorgonomyces haynaldii]